MNAYEEIKALVVKGKINDARLVYAREFLGDGPRRCGANLLKLVWGKMTMKELNRDTKEWMKERRELAKLLLLY